MGISFRTGIAAAALIAAFGTGVQAQPPSADDVLLAAAVGNDVVQLIAAGPKVTRLAVNDRTVFEAADGQPIAFINAYDVEGRWLVLLREGSMEGKVCTARFRVLDLSGPQPTVSAPFGTCSESADVAAADHTLTVSMPFPAGSGGTGAWSYRDGRLARVR